jgi:mRNA interferase RelE/StbE
LENPHITSARLSGIRNRYKIKLRSIGYRLVYEVVDKQLFIMVIAIGKRDKNKIYKAADKRII